jgi:hypothetical protein
MRPHRAAALRAGHPRVTSSPTAGLVKITRASKGGGRSESKGTSNRIAIDHTSHTSQLTNLAAHVTGGEPNTKLANHTARRRLGASWAAR